MGYSGGKTNVNRGKRAREREREYLPTFLSSLERKKFEEEKGYQTKEVNG